MTFAPPTLLAWRRYLKSHDADLSDAELGIVGGPSHITRGTSYHLGKDQLIMSKDPYSARTARDRAGLSNAASAGDIDDDLDELRKLSVWLVGECRANTEDTRDIREIIYSPDGTAVLRWDRERGINSQPIPDSDLSHRTHTHVSWYRDSEFRDKTGVFKRFFEGDDMAINETDFNALIWRVEAILANRAKVAGGPLEGEANQLAARLDTLSVPTLTDAQLVKLADLIAARLPAPKAPPSVEEIAKAVLDEDHARSAS